MRAASGLPLHGAHLAELHEKAFRRLGGATRVVVLDKLREGVLAPDIYDPALNPLYKDVLQHYGAVALPCRVRDPDRKGKVESSVGQAAGPTRVNCREVSPVQCHMRVQGNVP